MDSDSKYHDGPLARALRMPVGLSGPGTVASSQVAKLNFSEYHDHAASLPPVLRAGPGPGWDW